MKVSLDYGRGSIEVDLPDDCVSLRSLKARPSRSSRRESACCQCLITSWSPVVSDFGPWYSLGLHAICDITRPVPNGLILRPMIETMVRPVFLKPLTVLVATGLPPQRSELDTLIDDPWVLENVRVENHFARDDAAHVDLGVTPLRKVPVKLDRRFVDADLRVVTGLVEPHFMAGYSGGRKVIAPGIAHEQTIRTFHNAKFMGDPAARECNLVGNPLHEEQLAIVEMVGEVYALNTVLDEKRNLTFINFGHIERTCPLSISLRRRSGSCRTPVFNGLNIECGISAGSNLLPTVVYGDAARDLRGQRAFTHRCRLFRRFRFSEYREAQQRLVSMGPGAFAEAIARQPLAAIDECNTNAVETGVAEVGLYSHGLPEADWPFTGVNRIDDLESSEVGVRRKWRPRIADPGGYVVPCTRHARERATFVRHIHLDLVGGLAGDMFNAAVLNAWRN